MKEWSGKDDRFQTMPLICISTSFVNVNDYGDPEGWFSINIQWYIHMNRILVPFPIQHLIQIGLGHQWLVQSPAIIWINDKIIQVTK